MVNITKIYSAAVIRFLKKTFPIWQRFGVHVIPNHFYQPIPDTRTLGDDIWSRQSELIGVDMNDENQLKLLSAFSSRFKGEYDSFPLNATKIPYEYYVNNGHFESVDGEILYCMIRYFKPKKIFEIGSGFSTCLSSQALLKNKEESDIECELVAYEPYPNDIIRTGFPGLSRLVPSKIQDVPLIVFSELKENDILFIDSSHVLKIGSDVQLEYLEILPRLSKGVIIHIHDIFLPAEYPKRWVVNEKRFWNEQYILQAFLTYNDSFEVLWAGNYMSLKHPEKLETAFSTYLKDKRCPGSFWMRKIK